MSNWKNVNNWHWVSKSCSKWSKEYFHRAVVGMNAERGENRVQIDGLHEFAGDVDLNQRKGKIITIFDVQLTYIWQGVLEDGTTANGKISIPEIAHDTDADDYVFDISIDEETNAKLPFRELIRKELVPEFRKRLSFFSSQLIKEHSSDVYIEPSQLGQAAPPRVATPTAKPQSAPSQTNASTTGTRTAAIVNTTTVTDTLEFLTSAQELYETLLDPQRVTAWTRGPAKISREIGSKFELFHGNVTGEILELVPNQKIVHTWRLKSWPEDHFSVVTMTFDQKSSCVILNVNQTGVPIGQEELTKTNWDGYYWRSIKQTFGFGATF
ncbi:activator of Hsp90 ATPase [Spinellus fusiger]|nr:activator of Hsp90 ATPase [Spinellus fusiger]